MHLAALAPLALGVFERLHLAAVSARGRRRRHADAAKLDAWPMALAIAGALAWLSAVGWRKSAVVERVRYQPTGLPLSS